MEHDSTYSLRAQNSQALLIFRFFALHDDEAVFAAIDLILAKHQQQKEPWMTGKITLTNPLGVNLLTVPLRERTMVDDDGCDDVF